MKYVLTTKQLIYAYCKEIQIIQKFIKHWISEINKLPKYIDVPNKNSVITILYDDINMFTKCKNENDKNENDKNNKKRECIIYCIINNTLPHYCKYSLRWYKLKESIDSYIKKLCEIKNIEHCDNIVCEYEAGRNNHNDFKIVINDNIEFHIEFKFNAVCVNDTPQFVSPMKPSQYLSIDFEPWYYDNYLEKIALNGNLKMPSKEEYLKKIHSNSVECMKQFKEKYDTDINFNKYCKDIDKESIKQFIEMTTINMDKLSDYLLKSQKEKIYMCYKKIHFIMRHWMKNYIKLYSLKKKKIQTIFIERN